MDDIQQKLALIDKQLTAGPANLHRQIVSTCPLVFAAVGLIIGILIQHTLLGSRATGDESRFVWPWLILLALLTTATVSFFIIQQLSSTNNQLPFTNYHLPITDYHYATVYLALACFVCLGAIRLTSFHQPKPNDIRNFVTGEPKLTTIRGLIITEPYINENRQWKFSRFKPIDPTSSFYLKVSEVKTVAEGPLRRNGWAKATGTVRVQVDEPVLDLKAGDHIQAYCWLDRFKPPDNGQFPQFASRRFLHHTRPGFPQRKSQRRKIDKDLHPFRRCMSLQCVLQGRYLKPFQTLQNRNNLRNQDLGIRLLR